MSAHDRRSLQKQYAHFWRKDSVYLRLLSNIGEGRIEYNRPNSQYYCGRHDFVYNFGTSDEPLQQITIVLPFAGYYQFDRLAVECQKLDTVAARAENLGVENLQNVTLGTNSLGGEITTTRSSVLVVQLPYSTGWSVTVDGTPAQVLRQIRLSSAWRWNPAAIRWRLPTKRPVLPRGQRSVRQEWCCWRPSGPCRPCAKRAKSAANNKRFTF